MWNFGGASNHKNPFLPPGGGHKVTANDFLRRLYHRTAKRLLPYECLRIPGSFTTNLLWIIRPGFVFFSVRPRDRGAVDHRLVGDLARIGYRAFHGTLQTGSECQIISPSARGNYSNLCCDLFLANFWASSVGQVRFPVVRGAASPLAYQHINGASIRAVREQIIGAKSELRLRWRIHNQPHFFFRLSVLMVCGKISHSEDASEEGGWRVDHSVIFNV